MDGRGILAFLPHTVAIKLRIPKSGKKGGKLQQGLLKDPLIAGAVGLFLLLSVIVVGVFSYYYVSYGRLINKKFAGPVFATSAKIFAGPRTVRVGQKIDVHEVAGELRRAGYQDRGSSPMGTYKLISGGIQISPGPQSYHSPEPAVIRVSEGKVESITSGSNELDGYELEPQLVTSLFDSEQRAKRQVVTFDQIPKVMVDAVLAIEDRRFFEHSGINFVRLGEAAFIDVTRQKHEQGGSTITMQVSRAFFLTPEKTVKRKIVEMLIATELEQKFSKQQIFEFYANRVDLGQRGSFTISGFAEGARAYFNKNLHDITLPEAALLAGLIQAPSYLSPYRHPERALERRNLVLESMVETNAITREQADRAKATPLKLAPPNVEASDAPYFVDMVRDAVIGKLSEREMNEHEYRIYTTLDPALQSAAAQAVDIGMAQVDAAIQKMRTKKIKIGKNQYETKVTAGPQAQVALVALDPHTGEILALVGGRNYGTSQLNHALAKRPTGSIFKPFVYAAAMNTGINGGDPVFTPASLISDQPTTFSYGDQIYEPRNYKEEYHGDVTARYALAMSLNNATVKLAEEVGYDKVAALARAAGITAVKATPSLALGSYDATPVEMAAAYTVFANSGVRRAPQLVNSVRNGDGDMVMDFNSDKKSVLDPRVASVMTNMMEGVVNFGTAYLVRANGFKAPAAGKTGSSHDGWFAGYTTNLLCIVWVGYDDYSDIRLSGAQTAAPIWAEFMKRAVALPQYSDAKAFPEPSGVVNVQLDKATNLLATAGCPQTYTAAFIDGTQPNRTCDQPTGVGGFFSHIFGTGNKPLPPPPAGVTPGGAPVAATNPAQPQQAGQMPNQTNNQADASQQPPQQKKKGFFGKIAGIFKDDKASNPPPPPSDSTGTNPH